MSLDVFNNYSDVTICVTIICFKFHTIPSHIQDTAAVDLYDSLLKIFIILL